MSSFGQVLLAFLAIPTMVGMVAPWFIAAGDPWRGSSHPAGVALAGVGLGSLLWCVRDFYVVGKGMLAPRAHLSASSSSGCTGTEPMYVSILVMVAGIEKVSARRPVRVHPGDRVPSAGGAPRGNRGSRARSMATGANSRVPSRAGPRRRPWHGIELAWKDGQGREQGS